MHLFHGIHHERHEFQGLLGKASSSIIFGPLGAGGVGASVVHAKTDSVVHARNQLSCARGCRCPYEGDDGDGDGDGDGGDDDDDDNDDDDDQMMMMLMMMMMMAKLL